MPFAYVQVNALLRNFFNLLTPIAIACFPSPTAAPDARCPAVAPAASAEAPGANGTSCCPRCLPRRTRAS